MSLISDINRTIRLRGGGIPSGYFLGRASNGIGPAELISLRDLVQGALATGLIQTNNASNVSSLLDNIASTEGDLLVRGASAWQALPPGSANTLLVSNGASSLPTWDTIDTFLDAVFGNTNGVFITRNSVQQWTTLALGTTGALLSSNGSSPIWNTSIAGMPSVSSGHILANLTVGTTFPSDHSVSDVLDSVFGNTRGGILYRGASGWAFLAAGTSGTFLKTQGSSADPIWDTPTSSNPTLTDGHIFVGNVSNVATDVAMSGDVTIDDTGATTIGSSKVTTSKINNNAVTYAKMQQSVGASVLVGAQTGSTNLGEITLGSNLSMSGGVLSATGGGGGSVTTTPVSGPQGRLTLQTGNPVQNSDESAVSTIFYDAYTGGLVPIYNGSGWTYLAIASNEISMGLDAVAPHVASGSLYDVFAINNGGSLAICIGPAWSSTTSRGSGAGTTQITQLNGIWVNAVALTHAWGGASGTTDYGSVSANQATYLGTFLASANGQTTAQFLPAAANGGSATKMYLSNAYNRIRMTCRSSDNTSSWTTASNTNTNLNAGGTGSGANNSITFVDGLQQSPLEGRVLICVANSGGALSAVWGVLGSATTGDHVAVSNASLKDGLTWEGAFAPILGKNIFQACQSNLNNGSTSTYFGQVNSNNSQETQLSLWC